MSDTRVATVALITRLTGWGEQEASDVVDRLGLRCVGMHEFRGVDDPGIPLFVLDGPGPAGAEEAAS